MSKLMENVHRYFATTVALITTNGSSNGPNVMAAEWTMQISYDPMLIAIFIHESPTYWNIKETRAFGVNIASDDQAELVNIAGGYSKTEINKLAIPFAFETYDAKQIEVPMINGCALSAECKVTTIQEIGDHIMVIGEVVNASFDDKKFPLIYTRGNYRKLSRVKIPSGRKTVRITSDQMSEFKKMSQRQFVLKGAAAIIKQGRDDDDKVLLQKFKDSWIIPIVAVDRGTNYKVALDNHLKSIGVSAKIGNIRKLERLMLKDDKTELRTNIVTLDCSCTSFQGGSDLAAWFDKIPKNILLKNLL